MRDRNGRLTAKPRTEKAGAKLTLSGLLAAGKPLHRTALKVSLENGKFTALSRHYSVTTDANGAFKLTIPASMTGLIIVRYGGSVSTTPVTAKAGTIVVQPRIVARFTGIVRGGHIRSIHVAGRFLPVPGGSFTLRWQARVPHGRWQWIGATNEQTVVRPNGTFKGSWTPGAAIDPRVQYRLVLTPNVAPYPRTASAAATARIP